MLKAIVNLLFPEVCCACNNLLSDGVKTICVDCRHDLPITNFHFNGNSSIEKVLYGRSEIENGTALFRFEKKSNVQRLIHNLKYKGQEHIGFVLGNWLGSELKILESYNKIDIVIPVPLHKNKLKTRGYNQITCFGEQIAKALNARYVDNVLLKVTSTKSQAHKKRLARWNNQTAFTLENKSIIENKHILIVDDIITTGATLEACITVLNQAKNIKTSIATIAIA